MVATWTSFLFGGHSEQSTAGIPVIVGGVASIVTRTVMELGIHARSMAFHFTEPLAVSVTGPQPPWEAMPDSGSFATQLRETALLYEPLGPRVPIIVGVITGGVVSMFTCTVAGFASPAPFVAVHVTEPLAVSVTGPQPLWEATPDSGSLTAQVRETALMYQPFEPSVPVIVGVITGGVVSIFTCTVAELESPAPLVALHVAEPPAVHVTGPQPVWEATPDSGSLTAQLRETALVYHPLAPTVPVRVGVTTGGVVSIFTDTVTEVASPAPFVAAHVTELLAVNVARRQPLSNSRLDSASTILQPRVTALVYHPFAPIVPTIEGVITGGVVSIFTCAVTAFETLAPLVAVQITEALAVSVTGSQPLWEAIPDSGSLTAQLRETALVYQPLEPSVPVMVEIITGGVVST
jgi:hypothetical protein